MGSADAICLNPLVIEDLLPYRIIDVSVGDTHCLALTDENCVFAWGGNNVGQCGQGHTSNPITRPVKVIGLDGIGIKQISAGIMNLYIAIAFEIYCFIMFLYVFRCNTFCSMDHSTI